MQSPISTAVFAPDGHLLHVNRALIEMWGIQEDWITSGEFHKYNLLQDPVTEAAGMMPYYRRGFAGEACTVPTIRYEVNPGNPGPTKSLWVSAFLYPVKDPEGKVREVIVMSWDETEKYQSEKILSLLAETSELLGTSLDYKATLDRIARIATRWLEGWCEIFILNEERGLERQVFHHNDPSKMDALRRFRDPGNVPPEGPAGARRVIQSGAADLVRRIDDQAVLTSGISAAAIELLSEIGGTTWIGVPLRDKDITYGAICVGSGGISYNESDLALVQELANRATLAVRNAQLYLESQRAISQRDEFLSIASHELRTPLTSLSLQIESLLDLARKGALDSAPGSRMLKMFEASFGQLNGLTQLIDNLLDTTQLREERVRLSRERLDLVLIVRSVLDRLDGHFERAQCALQVDLQGSLVGHWDRFRLEQVVNNLLINALKYGARKPIIARAWLEGERACFSVQDFGIGIAAADQKKIFERFERATSVSSFGGMGLGLYIAREIVIMHGGRISVQSAPGQGSTFTVELPLSPVTP